MANRNRLTSNTVAEERRRRRRVSKDAPGGANEMQAGPSFETRCSASLLRTRRWGWRHWLARISLVVTSDPIPAPQGRAGAAARAGAVLASRWARTARTH